MAGTTRCRWCQEPIAEGDAGHRCPADPGRHATTYLIADDLSRTVGLGGDRTIAGAPEIDRTHADDDGFPEVDDLIDRTLGQYALTALIGRGSMGRVYRGRHLGLQRDCAIKVMNPGLVTRQPQVRERFWAEARAVANLVHPHIVTVHNLGSERGYHFIEMEYVPGGVSLLESLLREGPFDPVRASNLVLQVVLALGAAHEADLVHRDVKPSNVLLTADNRAKLADFGLVRHLGDLQVEGESIAGTPTFMAPELFSGAAASPRSDFYAVGVMYYYLLSGRLPFASDQLSRLIQLHQAEPVPAIRLLRPDVPESVAAILDRCLAKEPGGRHASAGELASDLQSSIYQMRDTGSLVRESLDGLNCFVQGAKDQYRIVFPLPNDRLQEVYVESAEGPLGERLLSVFSVCGQADPKHFEYALKLNDSLTYGSLSIRTVHGQPMFVMTRTFARDHVCAADVRAALLEIAPRGDRVEQQLSDADLY